MELATFGAIALLVVVGVATPAEAASDRGALLGSETIAELALEPQGVKDFLTPIGVYVPQPQHGVDSYRITYGRSMRVGAVPRPAHSWCFPVPTSAGCGPRSRPALPTRCAGTDQRGIRAVQHRMAGRARGQGGAGDRDLLPGLHHGGVDRIYHFYGNESEVFKTPYAGTVDGLFDGEHTIEQSMEGLPGSPAELLQESYIEQLLHPTGRLKAAALINDDVCLH